MPTRSHRERYEVLLSQLLATRKRAGVTQVELAERMQTTQAFVSKCERGERRLDVIDLLDFLDALGEPAEGFVGQLRSELYPGSSTKRRKSG